MKMLKINGREKQFPSGIPATLTELLRQLNVEAATVVAEIDGRVVESQKFAETVLSDGQTIELIWFVPGG